MDVGAPSQGLKKPFTFGRQNDSVLGSKVL
jgi:hypothetical protein